MQNGRYGPKRARESGFTFLGALIVVALISVGLAAAGAGSAVERHREQEQQLLFAGQQIRDAIGRYYQLTPGTVKRYPEDLTDLLLDRRHFQTIRHLRRLYLDPFTGRRDWEVVRAPEGGIMGVRSRSMRQPWRTAGLEELGIAAERSAHYHDWQFVYRPPVVFPATPPSR